mgnify:CR=1 FL=1
MSERINELLKQSRTEHWTQYTPSYDYEKFAELIVNEFDQQVLKYQYRVHAASESVVVDRLEQLRGLIKDHFGVK